MVGSKLGHLFSLLFLVFLQLQIFKYKHALVLYSKKNNNQKESQVWLRKEEIMKIQILSDATLLPIVKLYTGKSNFHAKNKTVMKKVSPGTD